MTSTAGMKRRPAAKAARPEVEEPPLLPDIADIRLAATSAYGPVTVGRRHPYPLPTWLDLAVEGPFFKESGVSWHGSLSVVLEADGSTRQSSFQSWGVPDDADAHWPRTPRTPDERSAAAAFEAEMQRVLAGLDLASLAADLARVDLAHRRRDLVSEAFDARRKARRAQELADLVQLDLAAFDGQHPDIRDEHEAAAAALAVKLEAEAAAKAATAKAARAARRKGATKSPAEAAAATEPGGFMIKTDRRCGDQIIYTLTPAELATLRPFKDVLYGDRVDIYMNRRSPDTMAVADIVDALWEREVVELTSTRLATAWSEGRVLQMYDDLH